MKRLALAVLLLAASCVVAAPAPLPKTAKKAEPQKIEEIILNVDRSGDVVIAVNFAINAVQVPAPPPPRPAGQ